MKSIKTMLMIAGGVILGFGVLYFISSPSKIGSLGGIIEDSPYNKIASTTFTNLSPTISKLSTVSLQVVPKNASRRYLVCQNLGVKPIRYSFSGVASLTWSQTVVTSASFAIDFSVNPYVGPVSARLTDETGSTSVGNARLNCYESSGVLLTN